MSRRVMTWWLWGALAAGGAGGCSVARCERGAVGCVDGPTRADGTCELDLVPQGGRCVRERDLLTGDAAAALPDVCGLCEAGSICASDQKKCLDFCAEQPKPPPAIAPPKRILCGGEAKADGDGVHELSFEETCRSACELDCRRWKDLCGVPCDSNECDKPDVLAACHARCDADADPLACMQSACSDARARGCVEDAIGTCPTGASAQCEDVLCANTCPGVVFDGVCDDGDPASAQTASCDFGTDCADCGPRQGSQPPPDAQVERALGAGCFFHEQCAGFSQDFDENAAFCAPVTRTRIDKRCLRDCSGDDELCPFGTACTTLKSAKSGEVLEDRNGRRARACVPVSCE